MLSLTKTIQMLGFFLFVCPASFSKESIKKETESIKNLEPYYQDKAEKEVSKKEAQKMCSQYNGKLIAHYEEYFIVRNCKRFSISRKDFEKKRSQGFKVRDIEGRVLVGIPLSTKPTAVPKEKKLVCQKFNRKYVTYKDLDRYWVERCVKQKVPDWETYIDHKKKKNIKSLRLWSLSWEEFSVLETGLDIPSVIDQKKDLTKEAVEVLPLEEVCRGLIGKKMYYYEQIYEIVRMKNYSKLCEKKLLSKEQIEKFGLRKNPPKSMSSTEYISIPTTIETKKK